MNKKRQKKIKHIEKQIDISNWQDNAKKTEVNYKVIPFSKDTWKSFFSIIEQLEKSLQQNINNIDKRTFSILSSLVFNIKKELYVSENIGINFNDYRMMVTLIENQLKAIENALNKNKYDLFINNNKRFILNKKMNFIEKTAFFLFCYPVKYFNMLYFNVIYYFTNRQYKLFKKFLKILKNC